MLVSNKWIRIIHSYVRKDIFDELSEDEEHMREICEKVLLPEDLESIQEENQRLENDVQGEYKELIDLYDELTKRIQIVEVSVNSMIDYK